MIRRTLLEQGHVQGRDAAVVGSYRAVATEESSLFHVSLQGPSLRQLVLGAHGLEGHRRLLEGDRVTEPAADLQAP